ncbi:Rieske (2Fe-2S) protein, partial [Pseudomonas sp. MPR-R5B]
MSPTRREVLRTVGSVTALAATSAVAGCNTFQNSNDVHTGPATVKAADV